LKFLDLFCLLMISALVSKTYFSTFFKLACLQAF
jgi:hypothetical protein